MADEKSKNLTGADGPDKDPAQPEAGGSPAPGKAQKAPEAAKGTKEAAPKQKEEKGTEPPKRKGRPPKEAKDKAVPTKKEPAAKKEKAGQKTAAAAKKEKSPPAGKEARAEKTSQPQEPAKTPPGADGQVPQPKSPVQAGPAQPQEAPRRGDEQTVYLKLSELHAFKDHPFQVRNDEEMKARVSSVKEKGVTQPAIVRPREDGGYEIVSGHRRQKASELAGYADMPCIIRNLTDEQAITQMVEDNTNQRENILPSERAKALKMQLEAIKHQGAKNFTSGQLDPKDGILSLYPEKGNRKEILL